MVMKHDLASQGHILTELAKLYNADKLDTISTQWLDLHAKFLRTAYCGTLYVM